MEHEFNRQVTEAEVALWDLVTDAARNDTSEAIRVTDLAESHTPIHPRGARQIARTWDNEGLVRLVGDANKVAMTEYGRQVDDIVEAA
jgi:hypothetical protein